MLRKKSRTRIKTKLKVSCPEYTKFKGNSHRKTMNKQQLIFWKSEREMLDRLYRDRHRLRIRG